ncbi:hypothetical protein PMIN07_003827 [Paraphaeosphaeria minitans]
MELGMWRTGLCSGWRRGSSMGTVHRGRMDMGELKRDMGNLNEGRRGRKGKGSDDGARLGVFKMKRKGGHGHEQEAAKMQDASRSRVPYASCITTRPRHAE